MVRVPPLERTSSEVPHCTACAKDLAVDERSCRPRKPWAFPDSVREGRRGELQPCTRRARAPHRLCKGVHASLRGTTAAALERIQSSGSAKFAGLPRAGRPGLPGIPQPLNAETVPGSARSAGGWTSIGSVPRRGVTETEGGCARRFAAPRELGVRSHAGTRLVALPAGRTSPLEIPTSVGFRCPQQSPAVLTADERMSRVRRGSQHAATDARSHIRGGD